MQIEIHGNNHSEIDQAWIDYHKKHLAEQMDRFTGYLTRIEVFFNEESEHHQGPKKQRCSMEARMKHHQPIAVTDFAETLLQAMNGASSKLKRSLNDHIEKHIEKH